MTDDIYKGKDTTRRDVLLGLTGTVGVAFATGASPAAAQMAQGHREVRPGTPPLQGVRVIERSLLLSGRLAGLLMADQGAEVFVERGAGTTPGGLDDAFFDRGKVTVPPGATDDATSADIVIVDGAAQVARAPHQILLRIVAALPGDEAYGHLPDNCSEDLIKALVGFFTDMSVSGPILNRPVIYTPIPLPSVYCAVNGAVAAVAVLVDRQRTGLGREIIASRLAGGLSAIGALTVTSKGLPEQLEPIVIGGLPPGMTPEQFRTFVADALREPERQMWLERRFAPFSTPYRAADNRWICRWPVQMPGCLGACSKQWGCGTRPSPPARSSSTPMIGPISPMRAATLRTACRSASCTPRASPTCWNPPSRPAPQRSGSVSSPQTVLLPASS